MEKLYVALMEVVYGGAAKAQKWVEVVGRYCHKGSHGERRDLPYRQGATTRKRSKEAETK
jgi:hypothetical protein